MDNDFLYFPVDGSEMNYMRLAIAWGQALYLLVMLAVYAALLPRC